MDIIHPLGCTVEEYEKLSKGLVGSLVALSMDEKNYGVGVITNHRRYRGEIHVRVGWLISPHFRHKTERSYEWLNYSRLSFISKM